MAIEQSEMERSWVGQGGTFYEHADPRPLKNKATSKDFLLSLNFKQKHLHCCGGNQIPTARTLLFFLPLGEIVFETV